MPLVRIAPSTFGDDMRTMLREGAQFADLEFWCSDSPVPLLAHRSVMVCGSALFRSILLTSTREETSRDTRARSVSVCEGRKRSHIVLAIYVTSQLFSMVLEFIYTGTVEAMPREGDLELSVLEVLGQEFRLPMLAQACNEELAEAAGKLLLGKTMFADAGDQDLNSVISEQHSEELAEAAGKLLLGKAVLSDTVVHAGGASIPAHRVFLCGRCKEFRASLGGGFAEADPGILELVGTSPEACEALLEYLYSDRSRSEHVEPMELLCLAHRHGLDRLANIQDCMEVHGPFDSVDDHILLVVLSFLSAHDRSCSMLVCRRWRSAAVTPSLWLASRLCALSDERAARIAQAPFLSWASSLMILSPVGICGARLLFASGRPGLRRLSLVCPSYLSLQVVRQIARACPALEVLHVLGDTGGLTERSLRSLLTNLRGLRELCLMRPAGIRDQGLAKALGACASRTSLEVLELPWCDTGARTLWTVAAYFPRLASLCLRGAAGELTRTSVEWIASCRGLRSVDLSECTIPDPSVLARLRVTSLCISGPETTDASVSALQGVLEGLEELTMTECPRVTNQSISVIAAASRRLASLRISNCTGITSSAMFSLFRVATLRWLEVQGCKRIDEYSLIALQRRNPALHVVSSYGDCDAAGHRPCTLSRSVSSDQLSIK
eukprot:m51a1_g13813 hypothetical protein (667) ;mRNA; r:407689-412605